MRSITAVALACAVGATAATAQTPKEQNKRALHGLMTMYAAGMVCYNNKWSFSKPDTDEMLQKIKELSKTVPKTTSDDMWTQAQDIMAEGAQSANKERCTLVRQQYAIAHPYLFGAPSEKPRSKRRTPGRHSTQTGRVL